MKSLLLSHVVYVLEFLKIQEMHSLNLLSLRTKYCISSAPFVVSEKTLRILTFRYSPNQAVIIHHSNLPTERRKRSNVFS